MTKRKISEETYLLLTAMVELAKKRNPVQGKFKFESFNDSGWGFSSKQGVLYCGSVGGLAAGYLPLLDKRFYFTDTGQFCDGGMDFSDGNLSDELGDDIFNALFYPICQQTLNKQLPTLYPGATKDEVIANAEYILANHLYC